MSMDFDKKWGCDFIRMVPEAAGVYLFRNADAEPIYVGKAGNLRRRLSQYRRATGKKAERKMRLIVRKASTLEYQICASETEALLLENQLIRQHRPTFNIVGAYAFLYPYLGFHVSEAAPRELAICYTTHPEIMERQGFDLFGAFRSRDITGAAFEALGELLVYIGHEDPPRRQAFGKIPHTRIRCFRQLDPQWAARLSGLFRGESPAALTELFACLLEKPGARRHAETVQEHLRNLRDFHLLEAVRLRKALECHGRDASMIPQEERDSLFLALPRS